jgi:hypothetical protein
MPTTAKALLRAKPNQFAKPVNKPQKEFGHSGGELGFAEDTGQYED